MQLTHVTCLLCVWEGRGEEEEENGKMASCEQAILFQCPPHLFLVCTGVAILVKSVMHTFVQLWRGRLVYFPVIFLSFYLCAQPIIITLDRPLSLGEVGPTCCARRTYVHCTLPNNLDWQCLRVTCGTCSQPIGWVPMFVIYAHSFCAIKNEKKRKRGKKRILYHVFFLLLFTIMYCAWCQARVTLSRTCPIAPHIDAR